MYLHVVNEALCRSPTMLSNVSFGVVKKLDNLMKDIIHTFSKHQSTLK